MSYHLPDGTKTPDVNVYEAAWQPIGEAAAKVLGGTYSHAGGYLLHFGDMDGVCILPQSAALRLQTTGGLLASLFGEGETLEASQELCADLVSLIRTTKRVLAASKSGG